MGGVYVPSQFGVVFLPMSSVQVSAGDTLRLTVSYTHLGKAENNVVLRGAIGNYGWAGFDEILYYQKYISVPEDSQWTTRTDTLDIVITTHLSAGLYDLYAKVKSVISPILQDVVEMTVAPTTSEFGDMTITNYAKV
jgi:hypothetical protein